MVKRNRAEWLLFEADILDIDLLDWGDIQLVVQVAWDEFGEDVFPVHDVKVLRFRRVREFRCTYPPDGQSPVAETKVLSVSSANVAQRAKGCDVEIAIAGGGGISLACQSCEVEELSDDRRRRYLAHRN